MKKMKAQKFTGSTSTLPGAYEGPHRELARRAAAEGFVLLKNEGGILPLPQKCPVALYGAGVSKTIKGGTGSGDVNERESVSIYQGMKDGGYDITNEEWISAYERCYEDARVSWREEIFRKVNENPQKPLDFFTAYSTTPFYLPAGPAVTDGEGETAIYVLSRIAGENADRYCKEGDYLLSREEHEMLAQICERYTRVIVAVNTGGLVDLSFMDEFENIYGLIQIMQPGMEGGHAFCDVISGRVTPSGKLTDSWALAYEDYPNAQTFSHNNKNVEDEFYSEGIYVGYRYFDSFDVPVRYPFGFGLSYTSFLLKTEKVSLMQDSGEVFVEVSVTNTGSNYSGREVIQVYASLPDGKLEKEYRRLCGFAKTKELAPNESQKLVVTFPAERMASYDEGEGGGGASGWILEKGYYGIWVGNSLAESELKAMLYLDRTVVVEETVPVCPLQAEMKEKLQELTLSPQVRQLRCLQWMSRGKAEGVPVHKIDPDVLERACRGRGEERRQPLPGTLEPAQYAQIEKEADELLAKLTREQMVKLVCGESNIAVNSNLGSAGTRVPGSAGETSSCAKDLGVATITLADGPAGLRLNQSYTVSRGNIVPLPFEASIERGFFCPPVPVQDGETRYFQYCTAIPVGTLLAQSWDVELLEEAGEIIGEEMEMFDVTLWLAPGMNLHRNPLCGRNFEYFSEDPLISGKMAAAMTRGVQRRKGCATTIKHFACNNQEDNRMNSNSILSERTFRELYARGFEIAVKESQPLAMMTSYNRINGIHAANHYGLCTKLVREAWGFKGLIMTDWTTTEVDETCTASGCIRAGNDLIMPGSLKDYENLERELEEKTLSLQELKACVKRILMLILQSGRYES